MIFLIYAAGVISVAAAVLAFVVAPSITQQIFGVIAWCGGWMLIALARISDQLELFRATWLRKNPG